MILIQSLQGGGEWLSQLVLGVIMTVVITFVGFLLNRILSQNKSELKTEIEKLQKASKAEFDKLEGEGNERSRHLQEIIKNQLQQRTDIVAIETTMRQLKDIQKANANKLDNHASEISDLKAKVATLAEFKKNVENSKVGK